MRARCWARRLPGRWTAGSAIRWSRRRAATRWPCWRWRWGCRRRSWPAGSGPPAGLPLTSAIEASFERRVAALPGDTRRLIQLAAADPLGDPVLLWRAAECLGIAVDAAAPAGETGLVEFGARVQFRHPLVRSAAYRSASLQERRNIHRALAEVTDPQADPDRRAWHRAAAAAPPHHDLAPHLQPSPTPPPAPAAPP